MKKTWIGLCAFVLLSPLLFAFGYEYVMCTYSFASPTPGDTRITSWTGGPDDGYFDLALASDNQFTFYGRKVTHLRIWTNGYVTFGFGAAPADTAKASNDPIPSPLVPNSFAAPWWDDWDLTTRGEVWYQVTLSSVVIEWRDIPHKNDASASYDFEVFFTNNRTSAPNAITFFYSDTRSGNGTHDGGKTGTVGIEHYTGAMGERYLYEEDLLLDGQVIQLSPFIPIYDTTFDLGTTDAGQTEPDQAVFRPSNGTWYIRPGSGGSVDSVAWGIRGDVALPGDFDGDGDAEEVVFRPSTGIWYSWDPEFSVAWGTLSDIPMVADFNNDGTSDIAVFRHSNGVWYIKITGGGTMSVAWGTTGDIPLPADYDGDGTADLAVYRPSNSTWYIRRSSNPGVPWIVSWGADGDVPFPSSRIYAQWTEIAVYRPSTGTWYQYSPYTGAISYQKWGSEEDQPVPADINGDATSEELVFRAREGMWYPYGGTSFPWGTLGDKPRCRLSFQVVAPVPSAGPDTKE